MPGRGHVPTRMLGGVEAIVGTHRAFVLDRIGVPYTPPLGDAFLLAELCFLADTGSSLAFTQCHVCAFMYDSSEFLRGGF